MDIIKFLLIVFGILFLLQCFSNSPEQRPLSATDCIHTDGSVNIGCIQRVNQQYGY